MTLKDRARQRENNWREYSLPVTYLVDFVLQELRNEGSIDVAPAELFTSDALSSFLGYSSDIANAYEQGVTLQSIGSPRPVRPLDEGKTLNSLIEHWAELGWVLVNRNGTTGEIAVVAVP